MRVIKRDGRILEPEAVDGKPTVTFPHLEIGDYIETEQVFSREGTSGNSYEGPHWFFREKDVAYARSEMVMITPTEKTLDVAVTGAVPAPQLTDHGYFQVRRWRVDQSPAAPDEPHSVPAVEYLPSVRVTWGVDLKTHLRELTERVTESTPIDPRIVRIAKRIVADIPADQETARARSLYRWILSNVQADEESDGRRVIVGKRGNHWRGFVTLCRSLGIPVTWALAKNRLAAPAAGPADEVRQFTTTALRVGRKDPVWLTIADKYTPFGYLPSEIRGMPAFLLEGNLPAQLSLPDTGAEDQVRFDAQVELAADGSAEFTLSQAYHGRLGATLRNGLGELGASQARDVIESKILATALPGARLKTHELIALDDNDVPLVVRMDSRMAHFALGQGDLLRLAPPFVPRLSQFATLPTRQTPILLGGDRRWDVNLQIRLPKGAQVTLPKPSQLRFLDHRVEVGDTFEDGVLTLKRVVHIRAGRIAPENYAEFVRFTRDADSALGAEIQIRLR
jgi:transglutaminase-like putative cysteine protease